MAVSPAFRQEDCKLQDSLGYSERPHFQKERKEDPRQKIMIIKSRLDV